MQRMIHSIPDVLRPSRCHRRASSQTTLNGLERELPRNHRPASQLLGMLAAVAMSTLLANSAQAQPSRVVNADIDYAASGFVAPAGMVAPEMYPGNPMMAGIPGGGGMGMPSMGMPGSGYGGIAQVAMSQRVHGCGNPSCDGSCDSAPMGMGGGCDGFSYFDGDAYGCDSGFGLSGGRCDGCGMLGGRCGCGLGQGGILSRLQGDGGFSHFCIFCRGAGCGVCQSRFSPVEAFGSVFSALLPYRDAGICAQRWYDVSAEGVFLSRSSSPIGVNTITQRGQGPGATPALSSNDIFSDDLEEGIRVSGAFIFGPGGNFEATYLGGQEWSDSATAVATTGAVPPDLFSFITNFGGAPSGPLDDVDNSLSQTATSFADFHSGEINYRRRTVGPYCRFQGSWLAGLRYLRYDNGVGLNILGVTNNGAGPVLPTDLRFFNGSETVTNSMLGGQVGGDFWWNVTPGINLGIAAKGMYMTNNFRGESNYVANSLNMLGGIGGFSQQRDEEDATTAIELETTLIYRLSHSWSMKTGYYLLSIQDIAVPTLNGPFILAASQNQPLPDRQFSFDTVTLQGFTAGAEYVW